MILGSIVGFLSGQGICVDDVGYVTGAAAQSAAVVAEAAQWAAIYSAMMLWQRRTNSKIADIRAELAARRVTLAEEALVHAQLTWDKERAFVNETMDTAKATPLYSPVYAVANAVEKVWESTDAEFDRLSNKVGLSVGQCEDNRTAWGMALAKADLMANTMRSAEARAIHLNDRRASRQLAVLGLGRGKLTTAMSMGALGQTGRTAVRDMLVNTINSGLSMWGYEDSRWRRPVGWERNSTPVAQMAPVEAREIRINTEPTTAVTLTQQTTDSYEEFIQSVATQE
jgi:hypothetical protein